MKRFNLKLILCTLGFHRYIDKTKLKRFACYYSGEFICERCHKQLYFKINLRKEKHENSN